LLKDFAILHILREGCELCKTGTHRAGQRVFALGTRSKGNLA